MKAGKIPGLEQEPPYHLSLESIEWGCEVWNCWRLWMKPTLWKAEERNKEMRSLMTSFQLLAQALPIVVTSYGWFDYVNQ